MNRNIVPLGSGHGVGEAGMPSAMSQISPSSSHQLVAAATAFRRARRKFPKNYGLYCNPEEAIKLDKTESISGNEDTNDRENFPLSSKKPSNAKSNQVERNTLWNVECGENASIKENLFQRPIICSCCRKRNEQCSAGDTLDIVPSKEYNGIAKKIAENSEFSRSGQTERCDSKGTRGSIIQSQNSSRGHTSYSHLGRRSPKETSGKLDSVNLLYDRDQADVNNVKSSGSSEKRNQRDCNDGRKVWKSIDRNSRCTFAPKEDNSLSSSTSRTRDCHCMKHSTFDLLRPQRNCCRQNHYRCCQSHDHSHHCCGNEQNSNYSSKEKRLASDTCLCSSNSKDSSRNCCHKSCRRCDLICKHDYCEKDLEEISTVQEQNDEELDDAMGTIYHKDSLCILVEKYKANKKCKHKQNFWETDPSEDRLKDECNKSLTSETTCQMDDTMNTKQRDKYSESDNCRFRDNRVSIGKACRYACGQIFREEDCNQLKNLKSRLIKTGTCCSAKGTPWRHTF